jgi:hypothetical protein
VPVQRRNFERMLITRMNIGTGIEKRILRAAEGADVFWDTAVRFMEGDENSSTEQRVFARNLFTVLSAGARTYSHRIAPFAEVR